MNRPSRKAAEPSLDLLTLLRTTSLFTTPASRKALLERMMDCLVQAFGAARCSVLLPDPAGHFRPAVTRNIDAASLERAFSGTVVHLALETRALVYYQDTLLDQVLRGAESVGQSSVRSVACHPLTRDGKIEALLYLDSPTTGLLSPEEARERLDAVGAHALAAMDNLREKEDLILQAGQLRQMAQDAVQNVHSHGKVIGEDPRTLEMLRQVAKVAESDVSTLITGESGTGKELIARAIHDSSRRRSGPFIAVNCGALPRDLVESELFGHEKGAFSGAVNAKPGKFELAHRGTLFLDEIGELPAEIQVKLLRALQERVVDRIGGTAPVRVDIRLISATNADLPAKVRAREFRQDLLYRVNVFHMTLPALRDRPGDIEPLARSFIADFNVRFGRRIRGLTESARKALMAYQWPGNVRELRNVVERAFVLEESDQVTAESLPFKDLASLAPTAPELPAPGEGALSTAVSAYERMFIEAALRRNGFNVVATARALGVARQTLYNKMEELGLKPKQG